MARSAKRLARSRVHRMGDGVAHAASLPARGAPAGRSPAPAEAYTPTLGTFHAAGSSPLTHPSAPERAKPAAAEACSVGYETVHADAAAATMSARPSRVRCDPLRGTSRAGVCTPRRAPGFARRARLVGACDAAWATPETIRWTRLRANRLALRAKRGRSACRTGSLRSRPARPPRRRPIHAPSRFASRLRFRLASLAHRGPRAPVWTRLRPSGSACGAWSLRSRSTGRGGSLASGPARF